MARHSRAHVRAAAERAFRQRLRFYRRVFRDDPDEAVRRARKYRDLRKPCSCWACGHRRWHSGAPIQERKLMGQEAADDC